LIGIAVSLFQYNLRTAVHCCTFLHFIPLTRLKQHRTSNGPVMFRLVSAYSLSHNTIESAETSRLFHRPNQPNMYRMHTCFEVLRMFSAWVQYVHYTVTQCTILHGTQRTHRHTGEDYISLEQTANKTPTTQQSNSQAEDEGRSRSMYVTMY
jgi:hypothetical protein